MPAVKELEREDETRDEGKKDSSNSWPDTGGRDGGDGLWVRIGAGSEDEIAWLDEKRADRRTVENDRLAHTRGWDDGGGESEKWRWMCVRLARARAPSFSRSA